MGGAGVPGASRGAACEDQRCPAPPQRLGVRGARSRSIHFTAQKSMLSPGRRSMPAQPGGAPAAGVGAVAGPLDAAGSGLQSAPPTRRAHTPARGPLAPPCGASGEPTPRLARPFSRCFGATPFSRCVFLPQVRVGSFWGPFPSPPRVWRLFHPITPSDLVHSLRGARREEGDWGWGRAGMTPMVTLPPPCHLRAP